jgi:hypothetical protein
MTSHSQKINVLHVLQVTCEFREDMAITVVGHSALGKLAIPQQAQSNITHLMTYDDTVTLSQLVTFVSGSAFCQQELTYVVSLLVGQKTQISTVPLYATCTCISLPEKLIGCS